MVNATGWNELFAGDLIGASFTMYDTALVGWMVAILFILFQGLLFMKTKNVTLTWVAGIFFASMYIGGAMIAGGTYSAIGGFVRMESLQIIFGILVLELAAILYALIFK